MNRAYTTAQVAIVGAGLNGAATAFFLAERGIRNVVVIDRDYPGAGASSRGMGLLRTFHANEPEAVLALKSLDVFTHWKERVGGSAGFRRTGFLWLDSADRRGALQTHVDMLRQIGSNSRIIDGAKIAERQPHLAAENTIAVYEPDCGTAYGAKANESLLVNAMARGVRLLTRTPALGLIAAGGRAVGVITPQGEIHADAIVLAAGAWCAPLARSIGIELPVQARRLTIGRVILPADVKHPMTFLDGRFDTSFRPEDGGTALISMRDDRYGQTIDPDQRKEDVDPAAVARGIAKIRQRIPAAERFVGINTWTGVDGFTPDFKGIYGQHHECRNLYLMAGGNEKGFKVSPAVGMGTAEWIATGQSRDIGKPEFSSARFADGAEVSGAAIGVDELI